MSGLPDPVVELLRAGHGTVARQAVVALPGVDQNAVGSWLRAARLTSPAPGVISAIGLPDTLDQRCRVALARCGRGARLGPWSSLGMLGIEGFGMADGARPDVVIPAERRVRGVPWSVRRAQLSAADRFEVDGLPSLSAARALMMLAPVLPSRRLRIGFDDARRRGLASKKALLWRADQLPRDPGAARVRRLFTGVLGELESEGERAILLPIVSRFTPPPEAQVEGLVPGRRLDFAWRPLRYALEYDGIDHLSDHGRSEDGLRDLEAGRAGVLIHHITHALATDDPAHLVRLIHANLLQRAATLGVDAPQLR